MAFDPNSAKKAGKKSKRGPAKKEEPTIKEKMELLYEESVWMSCSVNQDKSHKNGASQTLCNAIQLHLPKNKVSKRSVYPATN